MSPFVVSNDPRVFAIKGYVCAITLSIEKLANSNNNREMDNAEIIEKYIGPLFFSKIWILVKLI
jgi:hypothetical protein